MKYFHIFFFMALPLYLLKYNSACFITTGLDATYTPFFDFPEDHLSYYRFISSLLSNVIARIDEIR